MHTTNPIRLLPAPRHWYLLLVMSLSWFIPGAQAQLLEKKLTASDLGGFRAFGEAVAIDGDYAIVGDPDEEAAYLFARNQGGPDNWGEIKKLVPSYQSGQGGFGDDFGASVAISGDLAIVGAPDTNHSGLWSPGAAYLFARNQGGSDNWGEVKMLTSSNADDADSYGTAVAIQGDMAFVSAPFEYRVSGPGYGIDGFVYVYRQHKNGPNQWGQVRNVAPVAPTAAGRFGWALDVSDEFLLVGAPHLVCSSCQQTPGEAFVFARNQNGPDQWGQVRKILPNNSAAADRFGYAVALDGHYALISAQPGGQDGRAYIFERHRGGLDQWGQVRQLAVNDPGNISGIFGYTVALEGGQALVGDPNATVNGVVSTGAVYRFEHNQGGPGQWGQIEKREPSQPQESHGYFGTTVDVSGDVFIIGDPSADHGDTWICGAAFIYGPDPCAEDEQPPEMASVKVDDKETYRISLSLTDETGIATLDLTKITNAKLVALDPKPDVIKEGPEGEMYYSYFDTPLRINAVLEKISLREDIDFTLIVRDPCNPPFVLNWEVFWENRSKQAATAPPNMQLSPAYPNPFNPEARFTLTLEETQPVTVTVYDLLGRVVARLHEGPLAAGQHAFRFGDATWASGLYIYEVAGANLRQTRTITLLR